jgi:hypothetical protein
MKLANFLVFKAIVELAFGIPTVLVPVQLLSLYGVTLDPAGTFMARCVGASFIGIGLLCWFIRTTADPKTLQGIILALFITDALSFIVTLSVQLSGLMNALGWSAVAIWLLLALGLGYFRFVKPSAS